MPDPNTAPIPFRHDVAAPLAAPNFALPNFALIDSGFDTQPALSQLARHPELWGQHSERRQASSPHVDAPDIWLRFRTFSELTSPERYLEPHFAEFYPAWAKLPGVHPIVFDLMASVGCVHLGGILITKIPPGKQVKPHHDRGSWHAEYHNTKLYVPLQSNPGCLNICEDQICTMRAGEAWSFDNLKMHSVENRGDTDRITLIISMRTESCDGDGA